MSHYEFLSRMNIDIAIILLQEQVKYCEKVSEFAVLNGLE